MPVSASDVQCTTRFARPCIVFLCCHLVLVFEGCFSLVYILSGDMARAKSAPSDSDESVRGATKSKKQNPVEEVADEEEDENGSEYEIEEVLDAKRGYFPDVRIFPTNIPVFRV